MARKSGGRRPRRFTPEQQAVLDYVADGYSGRQIADAMGISEAEVRRLVEEIVRRMDELLNNGTG